tara:strand:+ start:450 stop:959 length:510 start_codon:yes stop_codon:yes gene_type:complete
MQESEVVVIDNILEGISKSPGVLYDKIADFRYHIEQLEETLAHKAGDEQSDGLKKVAPLKHYFEGGLYTRELTMPKGSFIISLIHKKEHPSFLLKGEVSYITDEGEVKKLTAPATVFTKKGTQRVFYVHKDSVWTCVNKTDATNVKDAELELYANNYEELINNKKLCQQ